MAKSNYCVVVILDGRREDYFAYWKQHKEVNAKGERIDPGSLSFSEIVDASSLDEAIDIAQKKHQNCSIDREGSSRIG